MRVLDAQRVTLGFIGLGNMGSRIAQLCLPKTPSLQESVPGPLM